LNKHIKKGLTLAVIVLFIGVSFQPIIAQKSTSDEEESDYNNVDFEQAKNYLFQTLIDISNNPDVKQFLNEHKHDLIPRNNSNYDYKYDIQKIYSKNPKLLKSIFCTKPKMTIEYLEKNYNKGLEIADILGEEESSKIVDSVRITNIELFDDLKIIILNDDELSSRTTILREINNDSKSNIYFMDYQIICSILWILWLITYLFELPILIIGEIFDKLGWWAFLNNHPLLEIICDFFGEALAIFLYPLYIIFDYLYTFECINIVPH